MSNSSVFKSLLQERNLYMEENIDEGGTYFRIQQPIKNGGNIVALISFENEENIIDINLYNVAKIENPLKREELHKLINELNIQYRYAKFVETEGNVFVKYSFDVQDYFAPQLVLDQLAMLLNSVQDEYPKFMKLQWA